MGIMSSKQVTQTTAGLLSATFLVIGLAVGFLTANYLNRQENANRLASTSEAQPGMPSPGMQVASPGAMMPDVAAAIDEARNKPDDFEAQMKVAEMYLQIQRADKAQEFLDAAAKIKSLNGEQAVRLANAYFDVRQFDAARPFYLKAVELNPNDVNVRSDLGVTFMEASPPDFERAFAEFETALKQNPRHEPTLFNLGLAYLKKGDLEMSTKTLKRLEEATPGNELATRLKQFIDQRPQQ